MSARLGGPCEAPLELVGLCHGAEQAGCLQLVHEVAFCTAKHAGHLTAMARGLGTSLAPVGGCGCLTSLAQLPPQQ